MRISRSRSVGLISLKVVGQVALRLKGGGEQDRHLDTARGECRFQVAGAGVTGEVTVSDDDNRAVQLLDQLGGELASALRVRGGRADAGHDGALGVLLALDDPHRGTGGEGLVDVGLPVEHGGERVRFVPGVAAVWLAELLHELLVPDPVDGELPALYLFDHGPVAAGVGVGRGGGPPGPGQLDRRPDRDPLRSRLVSRPRPWCSCTRSGGALEWSIEGILQTQAQGVQDVRGVRLAGEAVKQCHAAAGVVGH
jgi:hypothetical protein